MPVEDKLLMLDQTRNVKSTDPDKQRLVPVVSSTGKPLMPCSPKRARKLINRGRAIKRWNRDFFYLQMIDREDGYTQDIAIGIDPGSKWEGYSIVSKKHTFLNIQTFAINGNLIKKKMSDRKVLRKARRARKCPNRKPRFDNRLVCKNRDWLPPSTKARWQFKLNVVDFLMRLYPLSYCVIEDVSVENKKDKPHWNEHFSPVQNGKNWLNRRLDSLFKGNFLKIRGFETSMLRKEYGLIKTKAKSRFTFNAHCVDAWAMAVSIFDPYSLREPTLTELSVLETRKYRKRQLFQPNVRRGGLRIRSGGTLTMGIRRGSVVNHPKHGVTVVAGGGATLGKRKNKLTLIRKDSSNDRVSREVNREDLTIFARNPWIVLSSPSRRYSRKIIYV